MTTSAIRKAKDNAAFPFKLKKFDVYDVPKGLPEIYLKIFFPKPRSINPTKSASTRQFSDQAEHNRRKFPHTSSQAPFPKTVLAINSRSSNGWPDGREARSREFSCESIYPRSLHHDTAIRPFAAFLANTRKAN